MVASPAELPYDAELAEALRDMPAEDFEALLEDARDDKPLLTAILRARYRWHLDEFCRAMWPDRFNLPFNAFHRNSFARALSYEPSKTRKSSPRSATAAPRGYAKSTISTFAVLVHATVYGIEDYVVIISAGKRLALALTKDIKSAFDEPDSPLSRVYGPFKVEGGIEEPLIGVRGRPSVGFLAASFGSEVRGARHPTRGIRPGRVNLDDSERADRVRSPEQRAIWWARLNKDIAKLGQRGAGFIIDAVGTVLHVDSMLANLINRPGWDSVVYKAIISWPERADLWDECRQVWTKLTLGKADRTGALAFYEANRAEMDRGVEVLDPGVEDIFALYEQIWTEGLASFLQEKQNEPRYAAAAYFDSAKFTRFRIQGANLLTADGRTVPIDSLRKVAYLDPIPGDELRALGDEGGSGSGDFAAIAILGRDKHGYTYVLDLWMKRAKDSDQLAALWSLCERWGCQRAWIESVAFSRIFSTEFRRQRMERQKQGKFFQVDGEPHHPTGAKEDRIAGLEPPISNGWLQFSTAIPQPALAMFDDFPDGSHDDPPDAVAGAWECIGGIPVPVMGTTRLM